jgi:hypothetical protein
VRTRVCSWRALIVRFRFCMELPEM